MASAEGTDSIELESIFSSKNRDIHSSTLKSTSGTDDGKPSDLQLEKKRRKTTTLCKFFIENQSQMPTVSSV